MELRPRRPDGDRDLVYNPAQRLAYFAVVVLLFPAMIWTGLAMSPALTSATPFLVNMVGGQQSARTIHFAVAAALVVFLAGHVNGKLKGNLHLKAEDSTPMANILLTVMHKLGVDVDSIGDSTGDIAI